MCGIFGLTIKENSNFNFSSLESTITRLFKLSESRGKEAAGIAIFTDKKINIFKQPVSASLLVKEEKYKELFEKLSKDMISSLTVIGHTRLVTDGAQESNYNNQPVIKKDIVGIHNGIIVNHDKLWKQFPMKREYEVDTEVMLSLIDYFYQEKKSLISAVQNTFNYIQGAASIAVLFKNLNRLLLATNNGSLYLYIDKQKNFLIFASELYILKKFFKKKFYGQTVDSKSIFQVKPNEGYLFDVSNLSFQKFNFNREKKYKKQMVDFNELSKTIITDFVSKFKNNNFSVPFSKNQPLINSLKRCKKCILSGTFPFIEFDEEGVCNYCRSYKKNKVKGIAVLEETISKFRSKSGEPDCIIGISGGRDSIYGLHYIKNVLKMNPIVYTYDWGMITDLARRNISRVCGELGVEHILISADINKNRRNIRKNVTAWLKKPNLGMVPLFMAGDKQYFYFMNKLKKQTGINLVFFCENMLEKVDFKAGFAGIKPKSAEEGPVYSLSLMKKIKLAAYYAKEYFSNLSYFNSSILDSIFAYFYYYLMDREYLNLYEYIKWDEKEIISTIINNYDWELADDTNVTWRIGDGTAAFYNYIYHTVAGFTENDAFRSNQIREGALNREEAIKIVAEENKTRYDSIKWYCNIIGIDFDKTIKRIDSIPKLYNGV